MRVLVSSASFWLWASSALDFFSSSCATTCAKLSRVSLDCERVWAISRSSSFRASSILRACSSSEEWRRSSISFTCSCKRVAAALSRSSFSAVAAWNFWRTERFFSINAWNREPPRPIVGTVGSVALLTQLWAGMSSSPAVPEVLRSMSSRPLELAFDGGPSVLCLSGPPVLCTMPFLAFIACIRSMRFAKVCSWLCTLQGATCGLSSSKSETDSSDGKGPWAVRTFCAHLSVRRASSFRTRSAQKLATSSVRASLARPSRKSLDKGAVPLQDKAAKSAPWPKNSDAAKSVKISFPFCTRYWSAEALRVSTFTVKMQWWGTVQVLRRDAAPSKSPTRDSALCTGT
mmetsp:Transcript_40159/g.87691  ORF Transcript_40159/g.87691 Transcript_40159/m.87691 type:complete len:345 (-) Transcript_40159:55-1089(-)